MNNILNALQQHAEQSPEQIALHGTDAVLSYAELNQQVMHTAMLFTASGWHTLAVMLDNSPAWVVIDLAAAKAGITLVPLPAFFSAQQIEHSLENTAVDAVLTDQPERFDYFIPHTFTSDITGTVIHCLLAPDYRLNTAKNQPIASIKITYTSGTTGSPKGVCLNGKTIDTVTNSLADISQIRSDDVHLCLLPLATLLENIGGIYLPLLAGATIVVPSLVEIGMHGASGVNINRMIAALRRYAATRAILLPQLLQAIVEQLEVGVPVPQQLLFVAVGGAPVSQQLLQRAQYVGLPLFQGYGLSECCSVVTLNNPQHNHPGSVGQPLPHVTLRIAADGEILVKGALFNGYLGEANTVATEWWPTGDLGYLDQDGYLFISGRKKNIFITSFGRNVAPEWVEQEIVLHPAIQQAYVYGEARPWNIAVLVTTADDAQIQKAIDQANSHLPDYAAIRHWLKADAPFSIINEQMTATGRLRRQQLWQHYAQRIATRYAKQQHEESV